MSESRAERDLLDHERWQEALRQEQVLLGQECDDCERRMATPKAACTRCGSRQLRTVTLPEIGTVYSETKVNVAPAGFDENYQLVIVDLDAARVLGRIDAPRQVSIGDELELVGYFEHEGHVVPTFAPLTGD